VSVVRAVPTTLAASSACWGSMRAANVASPPARDFNLLELGFGVSALPRSLTAPAACSYPRPAANDAMPSRALIAKEAFLDEMALTRALGAGVQASLACRGSMFLDNAARPSARALSLSESVSSRAALSRTLAAIAQTSLAACRDSMRAANA